jgi:hypothetical protein
MHMLINILSCNIFLCWIATYLQLSLVGYGFVFHTFLSLLSGVKSWAAVPVSAIELYLDIRSTIEDHVRVGNKL